MKILVATDTFPPVSYAGAEQIAYHLAIEHRRQGHDVTVLTTSPELRNGQINEIEVSGVPVVQVGSDYPERWVAYRSLWNPTVLKTIRGWFKGRLFDVAHLHNIHRHLSYRFINLLCKKDVPAILTAHDAMSIEYGKFNQGVNPNDLSLRPEVNYRVSPLRSLRTYRFRYNPVRNMVIRRALKKVKRIVTVSCELERLLNANGITNTQTIHNGVDVGDDEVKTIQLTDFLRKHQIEDKKVILWAGRLSGAKGSRQVYELVKHVLPKCPDALLLVCGRLDGFSEIRIRAHRDGIDDAFRATGWLSNEEMRLAYQAADVIVVPSICLDAFPTIVLEAMSHARPVVASCFGGGKEAVVDEETGFIVNPFNIEVFSDRVRKILDNEALARKMGKAGYQRVRELFYIDKCAMKYIELMRNCMTNKAYDQQQDANL